MEKVNEADKEYRLGDSGPKYLMRGPKMEWGVLIFKPGQSLGYHYHKDVEETFYFLEGAPRFIVDDKEYRVRPGDAFRLDPGERHNIINDGEISTKAVFIKCPYLPEDKINC